MDRPRPGGGAPRPTLLGVEMAVAHFKKMFALSDERAQRATSRGRGEARSPPRYRAPLCVRGRDLRPAVLTLGSNGRSPRGGGQKILIFHYYPTTSGRGRSHRPTARSAERPKAGCRQVPRRAAGGSARGEIKLPSGRGTKCSPLRRS